MSRYKRPYPEAFREQLVELVASGRSVPEVSREFDVHESTLKEWIVKAGGKSGAVGGNRLSESEREELKRLRQELRQVKLERDILAKATAWFARQETEVMK